MLITKIFVSKQKLSFLSASSPASFLLGCHCLGVGSGWEWRQPQEPHSAMGAPGGGGEWALEAAIVGHSQFLPSFVSEENPLGEGDSFPVS